jgi:hypothetical protein
MARAPFLLPTVFVGCPYARPFDFPTFRSTLARLPLAWYYADTGLKSKHLLSILTTYIQAVDYCIFDLSLWNPNVSLELGLAEGLGKDYYILVNHKQSKDVPSDIKGIQRIEYSSIESRETNGLLPNIARYLVKDLTHPRHIWDHLTSDNRDKKFYLSLAILAHFRDNNRLSHDDITRLSKGLYLRKEAQHEVLEVLEDQGLISATASKLGAKLAKRIYPRELRFR